MIKETRPALDRKTFFAALFSGLLLFLSFPKFGTGLIAWIAFVPLLYALKSKNPRQGFIVGYVTGLSAHVGIIYWIAYVVVHYGYLPISAGIVIMLLLSAYLALYMAMFAAGIIYFRDRGIPLFIAAPLLWICLEYAKSHLFTGFPWENLGYSQYLFGTLIQIADIIGVFGLSFIIVLINAVIFDVAHFLISQKDRKRKARLIKIEMAVGFLLLSLLFGYGLLRTDDIEKAIARSPQLPVSIIQGNIDQNIKWHPEFQRETVRIYKDLTLKAAPSVGGLIIWPETATPFFFQDYNDMHREVISLPRLTGDWVLFGSPSYERDDMMISFFNSAYLLSPQGSVTGRYDKVHLVPFGEYVPLRRFFPFIKKLVAGIGDFRGGSGYAPLIMQYDGITHKLGVLICYEGILPDAGRDYRRQGASLLVNITNDAWFGHTSAPHQHLSMTVFRSVENRLSLVRAANTGISAIIDPAGRILSRTPLFEKATLSGTVRLTDERTFYSIYGDMFVYGCILGLVLIFILSIKRRSGSYD